MGRTLEEIWDFDDEHLEYEHDFIQFPPAWLGRLAAHSGVKAAIRTASCVEVDFPDRRRVHVQPRRPRIPAGGSFFGKLKAVHASFPSLDTSLAGTVRRTAVADEGRSKAVHATACTVQSSSENRACHAGDARPFGACVNGAAHIAAMVEFE